MGGAGRRLTTGSAQAHHSAGMRNGTLVYQYFSATMIMLRPHAALLMECKEDQNVPEYQGAL